jgi:Flp pilus assembly pilin Flp
MRDLVQAVRSDERGQDLIEYVLIIVFIALGVALALLTLKNSIVGVFNTTASTFNSQAGS